MNRTLYVTDMDGTLLDNNSRVSDESACIISELSRSGALITVATARTPATVVPLLHCTYTSVPAIVVTGAAMWDREQKQLIETQILAPGKAREISREFKACGLDGFIYTVTTPSHIDVFHGCKMNSAEDEFYQERRNLEYKRFHLGVEPSDEQLNRTILLFTIGPVDNVRMLAERLRRNPEYCSVSFYPDIFNPEQALIEVFAPGVSKAQAIKCLARKVGATRTVVFGDNLNDLSMMQEADLSVAVENAFDEVKQAADIVIGPNSDNSVARFIDADFRARCHNKTV